MALVQPQSGLPAGTFYIAEARRLARRGRLVEMLSLVQQRKADGVDAGSFLGIVGVQTVRSGCVSALQLVGFSYVLDFCTRLGEMGIHPSGYLGRDALDDIVAECSRLLQARRLEDCIRTLETLANCGFAVKNLLNPSSFVEACVKQHDVAMALRYAKLLPQTVLSYNIVMQQFRDHGDLQSVLAIHNAYYDAGVEPDLYTYSMLIDACGRSNRVDKATDFFEELLQRGLVPNVYVFNTVMNVHAKDIHQVMKLFKQMRSAGVSAELTTYNILLKSCSLSKEPRIALSLYRELQEKSASGEMKMTVFTYSTLIQIFGNAKMLGLAYQVKNDMALAGVTPNVVTWTSLVGVYSKAGMVDKALSVLKEMLESDCAPNCRTYNLLIGACIEGRQWERAWELFEEWKQTGRITPRGAKPSLLSVPFVQPDLVTYNTMLKASPDHMEEVLQEMWSLGYIPDKRSWSIIIDAYGNRGDDQRALEAFTRMRKAGISPDVVSFTAVIKACVKARDVKQALDLLDDMKQVGIPPNKITYKTLLQAERRGKIQEVQTALRIYEQMRRDGCPPDERLLKRLIEEWAEGMMNQHVEDEHQVGTQSFKEYGELLLSKVASEYEAPGSFTIDLQKLSKAEARASLLSVLRIISERHNETPVTGDLIIVTGPSTKQPQSSNQRVIEDVVSEVLQHQLGLPVTNSDESDDSSNVTVRRPVTPGKLRVSKQALNDWIQRRKLRAMKSSVKSR